MTPREFRRLFPEFSEPSWRGWNAVEDVLCGQPPDDPELLLRLSGRTTLPVGPFAEGWNIFGRGAGKSRWNGRFGAYCACGREYRRVAGEHIYVGIFAPDKKQAALTFRYLRGLLHSVPVLKALIVRETTEMLELSTGVIVEVIAANTAAPRGRAYAVAIVEEAAFLQTDEHGAEQDRELLRALRPALARVPGSMLIVTSSPYAMRGEVYRTWQDKYGTDDPDVLVLQADTRTMNPTFSQREIDRAYREDAESARAEYGGQFRKDIADLFGPTLSLAVDVGVTERLPDTRRQTHAHMDTSTGAAEDEAALSLAWVNDAGIGEHVYQHRWSPPFSPLQAVAEAAAVLKRYGVEEVQIDRFATGVFADLFAAHGITATLAPMDTSQHFLELLGSVSAGRARLLDDATLLSQLRNLERRTRSGGRDAVGHRPRGHDDVAAAAAGALTLALSGDRGMPWVVTADSYREWNETHREYGAPEPEEIDEPADSRLTVAASAVASVVDAARDSLLGLRDRATTAWNGQAQRRQERAVADAQAKAAQVKQLDAEAIAKENEARQESARWLRRKVERSPGGVWMPGE